MTNTDGVGKWGYPPGVPATSSALDAGAPSAPPLPASEAHAYDLVPVSGSHAPAAAAATTASAAAASAAEKRGGWFGWGGGKKEPAAPKLLPKSPAVVAAPRIEPQPWVKSLWRGVAAGTVGIMRVDLRRPTFPWPDEYDENNLLFKRSGRRPRGRPPTRAAAQQHNALQPYFFGNGGEDGGGGRRQPTGARLKIMRSLLLKAPDQRRPLVDLGLGIALDLDRQRMHGVARMKFGNLLSIKMAPQPTIKLGATWGLPNTGMALRVRYECPISNLQEFWHPPARLMVRIDNDIGTGVHLSPTGIEFDERRLALGDTTEIRAGATLKFPRSLPIDRDDPDALKLQIHRLSLKTQW